MTNETSSSAHSGIHEAESEQGEPRASDGYQTPIDESQRKTGMADETTSKPTAKPESGTSEQPVEGAPNQGTEKR
jgi:photosystem I subunit 4